MVRHWIVFLGRKTRTLPITDMCVYPARFISNRGNSAVYQMSCGAMLSVHSYLRTGHPTGRSWQMIRLLSTQQKFFRSCLAVFTAQKGVTCDPPPKFFVCSFHS